MYAIAERQLLEGITAILKRSLPTMMGRQATIPAIRRLMYQVVNRLIYQSNTLVAQMLAAAAREGIRDAIAAFNAMPPVPPTYGGGNGLVPPGRDIELRGDEPFDFSMTHWERSARFIREDITSELEDVRFRLTRLPEDVYKWIAPHGGIYQVRDNDVTSAQAQAMAWRVFTSEGIKGFTDRSGREWALSSYVEMAVRTASMRAYNASHLARMKALGIRYFTIPTSAHPCPQCFYWQGKVLTDGVIENPEIPVAGTIAEATAAGLFHPNCEHVLIGVQPGVTVLPEPQEWTEELAQAYRDSQTQRRLEREVRKARRAFEYAYDPDSRVIAAQKLKRAQTRVREFVRTHDTARQYRREQTDLSNPRIKLPQL